MLHSKIIKLLWKRFNTIYEKIFTFLAAYRICGQVFYTGGHKSIQDEFSSVTAFAQKFAFFIHKVEGADFVELKQKFL